MSFLYPFGLSRRPQVTARNVIMPIAGVVGLTIMAAAANQNLLELKDYNGNLTFLATGSGNLSLSGALSLNDTTTYDCDGLTNGGKLTVDADGLVVCENDLGSGGGGGSVSVEEGDSQVVETGSVLDFNDLDFNITESPTNEANISLNITALDDRYVNRSGDTATGSLNVRATVSGTVLHADDSLSSSGYLKVNQYFDMTEIAAPADPPANTTRIFVADESGFPSLEFKNSDGLLIEAGKDIHEVVRNVSGGQIDKGEAVYATGSNGTRQTIGLAQANSESTMPAIGIAMEDIADNSFGRIMKVGTLNGLSTLPTATYSDGDLVYVSAATAGALTNTEPAHPNLSQRMGRVISASNGGAGVLGVFVGPQLHDETGTLQNTFNVGDGTDGTKKIIFNEDTADGYFSWDGAWFTMTGSTGLSVVGISSGSTVYANDLLNSSGSLHIDGGFWQDSFTDCDAASSTVAWDLTTGQFSCGTDADTQLTEEQVEDFVGGMLGGTETHIAVTYQDSTNDIDFVVDPDSVAGSISAGSLADGIIREPDLDADNAASDGDILTYDSTGTNFAWITPNAGTDLTADLEEETHASEHSDGGSDEITAENLASACTDAQVLGGDGAGGLECQADAGGTSYNAGTGLVLDAGNFFGLAQTITGSLVNFSTVSGYTLHAETLLRSSGALRIDGGFWQDAFADCDASTAKITWDLTTGAFGCGTDDDVPESGDFGAAGDLDADGTITDGVIDKADFSVSTDFGDFSSDGSSNLTLDSGVVDATAIATDAVQTAELDDGSDTPTTNDVVMIDNADTSQFIYIDISDCDDSGGNHLNYDTTTQAFSCGTSSSVTDTDNQTIDVFSLTTNTLNLSLEDDGEATQTVDLTGLDHDALTNFVANEHIDWTNASVNFLTTGNMTGAVIYGSQLKTQALTGSTVTGFGLTDCDQDNQTLGWDSTTAMFTCGDDDNDGAGGSFSSTGSLQAFFDNRYVEVAGDTMTGALYINDAGNSGTTLQLSSTSPRFVLYDEDGDTDRKNWYIEPSNSAIFIGGIDDDGTTRTPVIRVDDDPTVAIGSGGFVFIGENAGALEDDESTSIYIGGGVGEDTPSTVYQGGNNVVVGTESFKACDDDTSKQCAENTVVGYSSASGLRSGHANTVVGHGSFTAGNNPSQDSWNRNVCIGGDNCRGDTTDPGFSDNTVVGNLAMSYFDGDSLYNVFVGGQNSTNQIYEANNSVVIGHHALGNANSDSTVQNSVYVGYNAGYVISEGAKHTFVGYNAGDTVDSATGSIILGYDIDLPSNTGSYQMSIGNLIFSEGVDGSGTVISSGNIGIATIDPETKLEVKGTISGVILHSQDLLSSSGALSLDGGFWQDSFGDCDNATTSKVLWDVTTGQFSCGTDQDTGGGGGITQNSGDARYVQQAGDTMSGGLLIVNGGNGTLPSIESGLLFEVSGAASGWSLHAQDLLTSSGGLSIEGTAYANDFVCEDCLDFSDFANTMSLDSSTTVNLGAGNMTFNLDSSGDFIVSDGGNRSFEVDSVGNVNINPNNGASADFYVNGDTNNYLLSADVSSETVGILVGITAETALEIGGTASGFVFHAQDLLTSSGTLSVDGGFWQDGLTDCDNATDDKILWDITTGSFSCGSDQGGAGSSYFAGQGLTLQGTDTFALNTTITGSLVSFATTSGTTVYATDILNSSGALHIDGGFWQDGFSDCDAATAKITWNITDGTFGCGTDDDSPEAGDYAAASIDGDDVNSNIAGRSLTLTSASPDTLDADVELYRDTKCIWFEDPTASDDFNSIWVANQAATIVGISCESDQTVNFDLQVDDGTPAAVNGSSIACSSTWAEDTSLAGDTTLAANNRLDLAIASVSGTPTWVSICWEFDYDD